MYEPALMRISLAIAQHLSVVFAFRENGRISVPSPIVRDDVKPETGWVETTTDDKEIMSKLRKDAINAGGKVVVEDVSSFYNWEGSVKKGVPEYRITGMSTNETVLADILLNWRHDHNYEIPMLLMQGGVGSRLAVAS